MADKTPELKLNPDAMPWGRSVEKRLSLTEGASRVLKTQTSSALSAVATAQQDVAAAQSAVNNKVTFSTDPATGTGYNENDTWFQRNATGEIIAQWSFVQGKWESRTLSNSVIANLDAGKITAGILNAALVTISTGGLTGQRIALDATGLKGYDAFGVLKTSVGTDGSLSAVDATLTGVYKTAVSGRRVEINPTVISPAGESTNQASISFVFRDAVLAPAGSGYPAGSVAYKTYDSKFTSFYDTTNKKATTVITGPAFAAGVASPSGGGAGSTKRAGTLTFEQSWTGTGTDISDFGEDSITTLESDSITIRSVAYPGGTGVDIQSPTKIHLGRSEFSSSNPTITIGDSGSTAPISIIGATTISGSAAITGTATAPTVAATTSVSSPRFLTGTRQYSIPEVTNNTTRDTLFPAPVQGDRCFRVDTGWEETYYAVYNATTNPGGANTAGWYPTTGMLPRMARYRISTAPQAIAQNTFVNAIFPTLQGIPNPGVTHNASTGVYTVTQGGLYQINAYLVFAFVGTETATAPQRRIAQIVPSNAVTGNVAQVIAYAPAAQDWRMNITGVFELPTNATFTIQGRQDQPGSTGGGLSGSMSAIYLGPA